MKHPRLGQHFLKNTAAIASIVRELHIQAGDRIIEIGSGHGELTRPLLAEITARHGSLIAIERDTELAKALQDELRDSPALSIHTGNALFELPHLAASFAPEPYCVVGNIPFYITGHLFRVLADLPHKPRRSVFTIQFEVAKRLTAAPPEMNLLAAAIQLWAEPRIVMKLPRRDFSPQPKVDSAIISCATRATNPAEEHPRYYELIRAVFKQPRKTISNNLAAAFPLKTRIAITEFITRANLRASSRPQDLSINDLKRLERIMYT